VAAAYWKYWKKKNGFFGWLFYIDFVLTLVEALNYIRWNGRLIILDI
jgi:hypothetical protein